MNRCLLIAFLCAASCVCAWSEEPVYIPDPVLKAVIEDTLWVSDPTPSDMLGLTSLVYFGGWASEEPQITDLTGLQYATNLQSLNIQRNSITSLAALSGLSELRTLILQWNQISNLYPLSSMIQLETIDLEANPVTNLYPLSGLSNLSWLSLHRTEVSDISPLLSLTSLTRLDLRLAPLDADDYYTHIPQIYANNPGVVISYTRYYENPRILTITSSTGGAVTSPGEGQFTYELGENVVLSAQADEGFVFSNWSRDYYSTQSQTVLTMDRDYVIQATFVRLSQDETYVDENAPGDPVPGDSSIGDPLEDGTEAHPFDSIQEAIDSVNEGATIFVRPGTYRENIDLLGKSIHLRAIHPADPNSGPCAIIEGADEGPVVRISPGGKDDCGLRGFVITRGRGLTAGAVYCEGANPSISNCLIVGNRTALPGGAAVYCKNSKAILTNCTVADNYADQGGAGLTLIDSSVTILNSILWNNLPNEILSTGTSTLDIRCCVLRGGWAGGDNLDIDPLFVRPGSWVNPYDPAQVLTASISWSVWADGDYHLRSQAGRWDPTAQDWIQDKVTSPCIDAGLASTPVASEPLPNGNRINLGAYGGTTEAGLSPRGF